MDRTFVNTCWNHVWTPFRPDIGVVFFETKKVFCSTAWFLARKRMLKKCSALISALLEGPIPGQVGGGALVLLLPVNRVVLLD